MKIYALSMDRNLVAIGFRRVVSYGKRSGFPIKSVYFLDNADEASFAGSWWRQKTGDNFTVNYIRNDEAIVRLAKTLSDADAIALSLMSVQRNIAKKLCNEVKKNNPNVKIIIGGYHPTIFPEDAVTFGDAICLGEGEIPFVDFLQRVKDRRSLAGLKNSWVRENGEIIKSPRQPIMEPQEMEGMPFMEYGLDEQYIFSYAHGEMKRMKEGDLIRHLGTTYNTIWSVGCPYQCSFCSQDVLIKLDKRYAAYRGPSPDYIISEIKEAKKRFPIDYVIFYDSNFLGRDLDTLTEFSKKFKSEIQLKFVLSGTNPVSIAEDKIKVLIDGGLVRIKMGFESANDNILKIFKRPARIENLKNATEVLSRFKGRMVAPAFEMIVDNPYETTEELYQTIDFLDNTTGSFTLSLFSLQFMPGTALSEKVSDYDRIEKDMEKEYMFSYKPTGINNLISVFAIMKPPRFFVRYLKRMIRGKENKSHPRLKNLLYKLMLIRRAFNQARFGDYSTFPYWVMLAYHRFRQGAGVSFIQKLKHFAYHTRVIKIKPALIPKICSGYFKTLFLKKNVLRTIEFALLAECNSKCVMCYASKMKKPDDRYLTVEEYRHTWRQASRMGAFSVILSGGEPTLRKDLFDIISVMDPKNTIFALVTNSLNLNKEFLAKLKNAGVETIHLSLDGTDAAANDRIRGVNGHFEKVIESIREAKALGFSVYISTVIMHNRLEKMQEMASFAKENGVGIVFSLACISGNWSDEKDVLLTKDEWKTVQEFMKKNPYIRSDWTINFSMRQECPGGREKISISCYGDVMGCGMNYVSFGNIRQEPLKKIWRRMCNFADFKRRSPDCLIGADHDYIEKYISPLSGLSVPVRIDKHPTNPIPLEKL